MLAQKAIRTSTRDTVVMKDRREIRDNGANIAVVTPAFTVAKPSDLGLCTDCLRVVDCTVDGLCLDCGAERHEFRLTGSRQ